MPEAPAAPTLRDAESWMKLDYSPQLPEFLGAQRISLAITTYQYNKLILLGLNAQGQIAVFERTFGRPMGLWSDSQTVWMSTRYQLWRFENTVLPQHLYEGHDRLYVPRAGYTTGSIDAHDLGVDERGEVVFVNTQFNCLARLHRRDSFEPFWRPEFISSIAPEDRCHLNGLAMDNDKPRFVTACGTSDLKDGWRETRMNGGVVMDVASNAIVARGLSMPHSPRVYRDHLYLHDSGTGRFGRFSLCNLTSSATAQFEPIAFCPGYLRGLCFAGDYAIVGLSQPRHEKTFAGLGLEDELKQRNVEPRCGVQVIDLRTGRVAHEIMITGEVRELYDVVTMPGVRRPMALGFKTDEIERLVTVPQVQSKP